MRLFAERGEDERLLAATAVRCTADLYLKYHTHFKDFYWGNFKSSDAPSCQLCTTQAITDNCQNYGLIENQFDDCFHRYATLRRKQCNILSALQRRSLM